MEYNIAVFSRQYPVLRDFVYHYIEYKELHSLYQEYKDGNSFWKYILDANLLQATIYWCMIFGADSSNPIHWKNLNTDKKDFIREDFRKNLLSSLNIKEKQWDNYWKEVVNFRDKFVAHRELNFNEPVPYFDTAFKVALFYDEWVRKLIYPDYMEDDLLRVMAEDIKREIRNEVEKLNIFMVMRPHLYVIE